jgi:hypothetical protein
LNSRIRAQRLLLFVVSPCLVERRAVDRCWTANDRKRVITAESARSSFGGYAPTISAEFYKRQKYESNARAPILVSFENDDNKILRMSFR